MYTIPQTAFPGLTLLDIQIRVEAFRNQLEAHSLTVGVPAPREDDIIEHLARSNEEFQLEGNDSPQPAPLTFADRRQLALKEIDDVAEAARLRYITPGAGQAATYLLKEKEAEAFKAAGYPAADVPLMVAAEVEATGQTPQEACDDILQQRDMWVLKAAQIEGARRKGKVAVESVAYLNEEGLATAKGLAVGTLNAL